MTISGKLEITIKINELPHVTNQSNSAVQFEVNCNNIVISVTLKPKIWKKLTDAQANFQQWVAAIAGTIGEETEQGFVLDTPNLQVFERKSKQEKQLATQP